MGLSYTINPRLKIWKEDTPQKLNVCRRRCASVLGRVASLTTLPGHYSLFIPVTGPVNKEVY